jgi:ADP-heptose:LPS heptosyltransferase
MPRKVLFVKLDAIGDYMLGRQFFATLTTSEKYADASCYFLGNKICKSLYEAFDASLFKEAFWIRPGVLRDSSTWMYFRYLVKFRLMCFDEIVYLCHSRVSFVDDFLFSIRHKHLIGSSGDEVNYPDKNSFIKASKKYKKLIPVRDGLSFEYSRNLDFAEGLLSKKLPNVQFKFDKSLLNINTVSHFNYSPSKKYIAIFPGANDSSRQFAIEKLATVGRGLLENSQFELLILGSNDDKEKGEKIIELVGSEKATNLCGLTSLIGLLTVISKVDLLISNETSAVHFAAILGVSTVGISNGIRFGRFSPYPKEIADCIHYVYAHPDFSSTDEAIIQKMKELCFLSTPFDINDIAADQIVQVAKQLLAQKG